MAPPRSQRRRRARLRKSLIGKDFRARKSEMLIHPPPPCGRPRRRHIGAQLRCCEPRGRMSCGSPMPRGEQIAIPAEWGRPTGRFFCVVGQALRVLPSDTSPETKVSSCRPSDAVVPELEAYERKRPHERQHRPWGLFRSYASSSGTTASEGRQLRSEEHTSELQSPYDLVGRLLLE